MNFGMITLNQSIGIEQNCVTWILFVIYIKTKDFFEDIASDVEIWFDTSNYDENDKRLLPIGINKKAIGFFKDELEGKTVKEFCAFGPKIYAYLMDDYSEKETIKRTKKPVIKHKIMLNYKNCLFNGETILKQQQRFKSDDHKVYTEEVNKTALSSKNDKRLQTFDRATTYPYGTNAFKVCKSEMLSIMRK